MSVAVYRNLSPLLAVVLAFCASAGLLLGAHGFERIGGLAPCLLCLEQREVHWSAVGIALLSFLSARITGSERLLAAGLGALALTYLFSAWLAGFHAGVEWGFWPGPDACAAGGGNGPATGADVLASINAPGPEGPPCSEAAWRMAGISMAGYNALISAGLGLMSAIACYAAWRVGFSRDAQVTRDPVPSAA